MAAVERAILDRLLEVAFPGRDEIREQLESAQVWSLGMNGGLAIAPTSPVVATVINRIPVEAEGVDDDLAPIHILLHVVDGRVSDLEIFREDGGPVRKVPVPAELKVVPFSPVLP